MKGRWIDALFNELGRPASAPVSDPPTLINDKNKRTDSGAGGRARRTSSPPKRVGAYDNDADYDLARHARSSLQIDSGRDGRRDPVQRMPDTRSSWLAPVPFPHAPRYSPERVSGVPNGPRSPLYAQELPPRQQQHRTTQPDPTAFVEGFATPERQYYAYDSGPDTYSPSSGRRDPFGPAPPIPPFRPSPSSLQSPSRLHAYSTPSRPHHSALASPERPHSSPNVPLLQPGRASNATSPSKSALHSPGVLGREQAKANQCHGTTGAGKRCTRVVGGKAAAAKKPSSGTTSPIKSNNRDPPTLLTISALRQLDRRLSIGKQRQRQRSGTPIKSGRSRQVSNSNEDGDEDDYYESGMAFSGNQDSDEQDEAWIELPVYCFQHAKQTLEQPGIFLGSLFIDFSDWIPQALPQETKLQLRHEISKPISSDDIPGYIYVHEMAGADANYSPTTFIKLGRSVKPVARLSQWKSQCRSRQPIVRDIFPLHPSHPLHPQATASSLINGSPSRMHGALSFAPHGTRNHHRWERLCLIELAGLAALQAAERNETEQARQKCSDCGKIHVELFLVNRGSYEREIRGIVLRWQRFVETIG